MTRLEEIAERLSAIATECESVEGEELRALETETDELIAERDSIQAEITKRAELRSKVAAGVDVTVVAEQEVEITGEESRAMDFKETKRMTVDATETRATLISGGTLATPTGVEGINEKYGAKVSSIVDMVKVVNCEGMGSNKIAYIDADIDAASEQTEGSTVDATDPTFGYVTITPTSVLAISQISKQAKKQSPLMYQAKVQEQALLALRKKAASVITSQLKASTLNASVDATVDNDGKGVIDQYTLRKLALNYGGDESVLGEGVLFLTKTDLIAFGDVRGTNEKLPVYEITPDASNPNTGVIKDGGLSVKYCLNSGLTACDGTSQGAADKVTMIYGNPMALELDLFSNYEIRVSEDFAIDKLLDTIVGDVELGADVVAKNAFVTLTIPKTV